MAITKKNPYQCNRKTKSNRCRNKVHEKCPIFNGAKKNKKFVQKLFKRILPSTSKRISVMREKRSFKIYRQVIQKRIIRNLSRIQYFINHAPQLGSFQKLPFLNSTAIKPALHQIKLRTTAQAICFVFALRAKWAFFCFIFKFFSKQIRIFIAPNFSQSFLF